MDDKANVSYFEHQGVLAIHERIIKRLIIAIVISGFLLFASNAIWVYCWMQYDYTSTESTVEIDGKDGIANYIGHDGDISNGKD